MARRECPLDIKRLVYPFLRKVLRFGDICKLSDAGLDGEHVDRLGVAQQGFSADIKSVFYTLQTKQEKILEHVLTLIEFVLTFQTFQACFV